jgi:hypothetical protein
LRPKDPFPMKFIDGAPVDPAYAEQIAAFTASVIACGITEDDELLMGNYWAPEQESEQQQEG